MPVGESFPVRGGMMAAGFLTAAIVFAVIIPDKGEVVRLVNRDAHGEQRETDLWIAKVDGYDFFRAASPEVEWLARLEVGELSYIERAGRVIEIETEIETDLRLRDLLDRAMAEKYGLADRIWGSVRSAHPVAVRIRPVESTEGSGSGDNVDNSRNDSRNDSHNNSRNADEAEAVEPASPTDAQ